MYSFKTLLSTGLLLFAITLNSCQSPKSIQAFDASKCKTFKDEMPDFDQIKGLKNVKEYEFCHDYYGKSKLRIINSEEELRLLIDPKCTDIVPSFNYDKTTLLGYYLEGGGCEVNFKRKVVKKGNTYTVYIKSEESGSCDMLAYSMNWLALPKLKPEDKVVVKTGRLTCREY